MMGADSLEYVSGSTPSNIKEACSFSVNPFTANGTTAGKTVVWSQNTTVLGPVLTISSITSSSFRVTAQARSDDGFDYRFALDGGLPMFDSCEGQIAPGEACTFELTGLSQGKTFTLYAVNAYGQYDPTGWSSITVTLPAAARALAVSRE